MKLLGTMCGILEMMEEEGAVLAVRKPDGTVSEVAF
jgi:hypothetical protein